MKTGCLGKPSACGPFQDGVHAFYIVCMNATLLKLAAFLAQWLTALWRTSGRTDFHPSPRVLREQQDVE